MKFKIVADSASDMLTLDGVPFTSVPLKINTSEKEYVDVASLDVDSMVADLLKYKGKSGTACPGPGEWIEAFEDAEYVFCVTITSNLSGSYNAACVAKDEYEKAHPGRKVYIVDSLSAGSEMWLLVEKLRELIQADLSFDEICQKIATYNQHTHMVFSLESIQNLANNGRVNPAIAKIVGLLGIRMVGIAEDGRLAQKDKSRGEKRAISDVMKNMKEQGYAGGKVLIHNCQNEAAANSLKEQLLAVYPGANIRIGKTRGLCSFYAEKGGLMVGFEDGQA